MYEKYKSENSFEPLERDPAHRELFSILGICAHTIAKPYATYHTRPIADIDLKQTYMHRSAQERCYTSNINVAIVA